MTRWTTCLKRLRPTTLSETVGYVEDEALVITMHYSLVEAEAETPRDTLGDVKTEASPNTLADSLAEVKAEKVGKTLKDEKGELLV